MRDEEIIARLFALRDELMRQIYQFERDKVSEPDERARAALKSLIESVAEVQGELGELQGKMTRMEGSMIALMSDVDELQVAVTQLQVDLTTLTGRVTLCEGRIGRLEAKP
jgi:chromosome segregation ATPase